MSHEKGFGLAVVKEEGKLVGTPSAPVAKEEQSEWMELPVKPFAPYARRLIHEQVDKWLDDFYAGRTGA